MRAPVGGLAVLLCLAGGAARSDSVPEPYQSSSFQMERLETEDLELLYFMPQEYLAPHVARSFLNSHDFQRRVFNWEPWERTIVLLKDFSDYGNAAARSSPNNAILIDVAPLSQAFETFTAAERIFTLMNHEPVHVATMDVWNSEDAWWRHFFHGKPMPIDEHPESILYNYLATPRVNVPRWYLEGSAVFMETWMAGGIGRAQGAYDEMVFRSKVRDDAAIYDALGLEAEGSAVDFQVGVNAYLYGTRFFNYLALTYSPEKVIEWLKRGEDSDRYYSNQFERVFGKPLVAAWEEWIAFERDFQAANLKEIEKFPTTEARRLSTRALGSISRAFVNLRTQSLIGGFRYLGVVAHIGDLDMVTGHVRRLTDIKGPMLYRVTSLAFDPESNKAWYTTDNYAFRDIVEIDIASGETRVLIEDGRIGDLVLNPKDKSLWGLRHLNGLVTLVRMAPPYTNWTQIYTWPYGEIPFDPDISPDGQLLSTSLSEVSGKQTLRVYRLADLSAGKAEPIALFDFGTATPEGFVFSTDGRYLFGSSYYTGVSNIFRFELATREIEAVSNAVTGYFRPIPQADGSLIVFEYTGQGFTPVVIDPVPLKDVSAVRFLGNEVVKKHPVVRSWVVGSPAKVLLDAKITGRGKYVPIDEMKLSAAYPVIESYKGYGALGWHVMFEDPMQFSKLYITGSFSPSESLREPERWHLDIRYQGINWHFRYWHNDADFYDLFGPVERSRKGDALLGGYKEYLVYDVPRELIFTADLGLFTGLDTLPANQNVPATAEDLISGSLMLDYKNTDKSLGAVDHEKGWEWDLELSSEYADEEFFPKARGGINFGFALPWDHASLWFYNAAGIAGGDRFNVLTPFYFGSFRNNYVDNREVKRYREYQSFPGFEIDEIGARSFVKSVVELNLPPIRYSNIGTPSLYLGSTRAAVFAGTLLANPAAQADRTFHTVGFQIDWNFTLAHRLPMTLSTGYAAGFEGGSKVSDEVLISLKIM